MPIHSTNQPNAGFSFWEDMREEIAIPMKIPVIENAENLKRKGQSIKAPEETSPANPTKALAAITIREVPTDIFMGIRAKKTRAGIIRNPPPIPTIPVSMPVKNPMMNT